MGRRLPDGNPPSGVASGYVWFDVMALLTAPLVLSLLRGSHMMGLRRSGVIGECDARTQVASICGHMGATEDAAARRRARPSDTSFIV